MKDERARSFIRKLIAQGPSRPSASELLEDPFLKVVTESDKQGIEVDQTIMVILEVLCEYRNEKGLKRWEIRLP